MSAGLEELLSDVALMALHDGIAYGVGVTFLPDAGKVVLTLLCVGDIATAPTGEPMQVVAPSLSVAVQEFRPMLTMYLDS